MRARDILRNSIPSKEGLHGEEEREKKCTCTPSARACLQTKVDRYLDFSFFERARVSAGGAAGGEDFLGGADNFFFLHAVSDDR